MLKDKGGKRVRGRSNAPNAPRKLKGKKDSKKRKPKDEARAGSSRDSANPIREEFIMAKRLKFQQQRISVVPGVLEYNCSVESVFCGGEGEGES